MKINVTVVPNARAYLIEKISDDTYKVRVDAPATDGKANTRLIELLADCAGLIGRHVRRCGAREKRKNQAQRVVELQHVGERDAVLADRIPGANAERLFESEIRFGAVAFFVVYHLDSIVFFPSRIFWVRFHDLFSIARCSI